MGTYKDTYEVTYKGTHQDTYKNRDLSTKETLGVKIERAAHDARIHVCSHFF